MLTVRLSLIIRLSEQSRLSAEQKRLLSLIKEKYEDSMEWNNKYEVNENNHNMYNHMQP